MIRPVLALLFVLALALAPRIVWAGELDLTGDLSTFTSPGNVTGPWHSLTGTYRWVAGSDTPSVTAVTRVDSDGPNPTHSVGTVLDDYHTWSPRFFTYGAIGLAAGTVLPTRSFYVEGDAKLGRAMTTVIGGGLGVVVNPDGVVQRYLNVGPTFYAPSYNVTLRYLQTFTTGRTAAGTGLLTFQAGRSGATVGTLTLIAGSQPPNGLASQFTGVSIGQRTVSAGIGIKHWTSPNGGFLAGFDIERLNDRMSGALIYVRRGITAGFFHNIGPALP